MKKKKLEKITVLFNEVKISPSNNPQDLLTEAGGEDDAAIIAKALKNAGFKTGIFEVNQKSISQLKNINADLFFNLCDGVGDLPNSYYKIPELLDELHSPYTGGNAKAMLLTTDKAKTKKIFQKLKIPTPEFAVYKTVPKSNPKNLFFPLIVKPSRQDCSMGITEKSVVNNLEDLQKQIKKTLADYHEEVMVEKYIDGREFNLTIIGNDNNITVFPIAEIIFGRSFDNNQKPKIVDFEAKWVDNSINDLDTTSSLPKDLKLLNRLHLEKMAIKAYKACGCRDYARIDIRLGKNNVPYFLEINVNPDLYPGMGASKTASRAGLSHDEFIKQITLFAARRYDLIF